MILLAIDIGGTNSRFAHFNCQSKTDFQLEQVFETATSQKQIACFQDLLNIFETTQAEAFLNIKQYDIVSIAIAGPVIGKCASPPNISWEIDLDAIETLTEAFLLNDFMAQACAFTSFKQRQSLKSIREHNNKSGTIALVGAGTGLGHCAMIPVLNTEDEYQLLSSEAGQASFSFYPDEKELASFILAKTDQEYASNDMVVSGSGLSLIYEFFTGIPCSTESVFKNSQNNEQTLNTFSRFYARACRNYCLATNINDSLIISGGIAAKHPEIIDNDYFLDEFENAPNHRSGLNTLSIYLNQNEHIGLTGACIYALNKYDS